ncbi:MAG: FAD-dependent oxidoreductase, partial [Rhodoferax sp.]|nr:FAD-dependent oxidoreductase [Rhodoferax sp.]
MSLRVLVSGGGIGGLAAALACGRAGTQVELFERAEAFGEVGAGIQIGPNVTRILAQWGLSDALAEVAAFPTHLQVHNAASGESLGVLPLGATARARYGAPYATVHRADLHALLLRAVQRQSGAGLHLDSALTGFSQSQAQVRVQTA